MDPFERLAFKVQPVNYRREQPGCRPAAFDEAISHSCRWRSGTHVRPPRPAVRLHSVVSNSLPLICLTIKATLHQSNHVIKYGSQICIYNTHADVQGLVLSAMTPLLLTDDFGFRNGTVPEQRSVIHLQQRGAQDVFFSSNRVPTIDPLPHVARTDLCPEVTRRHGTRFRSVRP